MGPYIHRHGAPERPRAASRGPCLQHASRPARNSRRRGESKACFKGGASTRLRVARRRGASVASVYQQVRRVDAAEPTEMTTSRGPSRRTAPPSSRRQGGAATRRPSQALGSQQRIKLWNPREGADFKNIPKGCRNVFSFVCFTKKIVDSDKYE